MTIRRFAAVAGALGLAVTALAAATSDGEDDGNADLVGYFTDASPLDPGSEVRAAGVRVGTVESIELQDDVARVVFDVDRDLLPVHDDATMVIRPINVLGEAYVDLDEGTADASYLESGEIPVKQTRSSVTLGDVLNTFNSPTATGLAGLIEALGTGFEGNGAEVAAAVKKLAPSMISAEEVADILDGQLAALTRIVDRVHPVADALADGRGRTLDRLVGNTTTVLRRLSEQQEALGASLVELPSTLDTVVVTLNHLSDVSESGAPLVRSLRPVTDNLTDVTSELVAFANSANPALEQLIPLVEDAGELLDEARPIATELRGSGEHLKRATGGLRPIADEVLDKNLFSLMEFVRKWALSTNDRDGLGHYFRGVFHVTPASLNSLLGMDAIPSPPTDDPDDGPPTEQPPPGIDDTIDDLLNGVLPNRRDGLNGALGLNHSQELDLLDQLVGGN